MDTLNRCIRLQKGTAPIMAAILLIGRYSFNNKAVNQSVNKKGTPLVRLKNRLI